MNPITTFLNNVLVENFKKVVAKVSTLPKPNVDELFATAKVFVNEADKVLVQKSEDEPVVTGWDKLKWVVDKLKPLLPSGYGEIASTVLTIIVAGARLFTLIKK